MLIEEMALDLERTNAIINIHTSITLRQLNNKKNEIVTMERAGVWLPKAERIFQLTSQYTSYLNGLKKNKDSKSDSIISKTDFYTKELMTVDNRLAAEFSNEIIVLKEHINTKYHINNISTDAFIETLINKSKRIEWKMIIYCNEQVGSVDGHLLYDYYSAVIGQNSTILKPGETLEINAGIGAYSWKVKPTIVVDGKVISLSEYGVSVYKTRVPLKPGNYKLPMRISYYNQYTGKEEFKNSIIEYTVAKPCN